MVKKKKAICSRVKTMIVMLLYALLSQLSAYLTLRNLLEIEITERDVYRERKGRFLERESV